MAQNTSPAVMQQRREAADSLDDFPSPPWAGRALCEALIARGFVLQARSLWEPACNRGYLLRGLADYFPPDRIFASDVHDYGWPGMDGEFDFLMPWPASDLPEADWIITNPPFNVADDFIRLGLDRAKAGVAVLVRTSFLAGQARFEALFRRQPPRFVLQFTERVVMHKGALRQAGARYWDAAAKDGAGEWKTASTATDYAWLVWARFSAGKTEFGWIAPSRGDLEREGDYPPLPAPPDAAPKLL